jgi:hypothetical protein
MTDFPPPPPPAPVPPDDFGVPMPVSASAPMPTVDSGDVLGFALSAGWRAFTTAWPLTLVGALVVVGGSIPSQILGLPLQFSEILAKVNPGLGMAAILLGLLGTIAGTVLAQWPAQVGAAGAGLAAVRGRKDAFGVVLEGFRRFGTSIFAMFLYTLATIASFIPGGAILIVGAVMIVAGQRSSPGGLSGLAVVGIAVAALGGLVVMCSAFYVSARLLPLSLRVVDPDLPRIGAVEAFAETWRMTRGHALAGVGVLLIGGAAVFAGVLMCCVGALLFGMPLVLAFNAAYYEALRLKSQAARANA